MQINKAFVFADLKYWIFQLEKDLSKKDQLEEDVQKEEELLEDFLNQNATTEQILNIVPATGILLAKATNNVMAVAEIVSQYFNFAYHPS